MANGADGSIIINTELDNSGFQRGEQKMRRAITGLNDVFNGLGRTMQSTVSGAVQTVRADFESTANSAQAAGTALQQSVSAGQFDSELSSMGRACNTLQTQLTRMQDAAAGGFKTDGQMLRFQAQIERVKQSLADTQDRLAAMGQQQVSTRDFEDLSASIEKTSAHLETLLNKQDMMSELGVSQSSQSWRRLQIEIRNTEEELARLENGMRAAQDAGTGYTIGGDNSKWQRMSAQMQEMAAQVQRFEQMASGFNAIQQPAETSEEALEDLDAEMKQKPADAGRASGALNAFGSVISSMAQHTVGAAKTLAAMPFRALASGARAAAGKLMELTKNNKSASISSKGLLKSLTSLKTMLISRVKRSFISGIFKDFSAAQHALAKYSSAFNASMSSMMNASKGLSGNVAVSFGNLVNAVAPAITTIINLISQAVTYLNAFFSLLSGKGTMTVAKKSTDDYAKSLKSAGGAAQDLKNQVYGFDELNKEQDKSSGGGGSGAGAVEFEDVALSSILPEELMSYFQSIKAAIEAQDWEGLGHLVADGLNYIALAVDGWILNLEPQVVRWTSNIARTLNGLVDGVNWELMGKTVADGLMLVLNAAHTVLMTFDFNALGDGLGRGLNSIFSGINWQTLGSTFASKWNALIHGVQGFVHAVDWTGIGSSVSAGITSWFMTIDWQGLADALAVGVNGVAGGLMTILTETPWQDMGEIIGEAIMSWAELVNWPGLGATFSSYLMAFFQTLNSLMESINWKDLGRYVASILTEFDLVGWAAEGGRLSHNLSMSFMESLAGFIEGIDWQQLGTDLWNALLAWINSMDYSTLVSVYYEMLGAAFGAAGALIVGLGSAIWDSIKQAWEYTKTYFQSYFDLYGGDIVKGLFAGILNALGAIAVWVYENIFQPFINGFKAAFGINSPSTVMQEMGGYLVEGLLNGIKAAWDGLTTWFSSALESIKTLMTQTWTAITTATSTAWTGMKNTVTTIATGIQSTLTSTWSGIKTTASTAWTNVKTTVSTLFSGLQASLTGTAEQIKTGLTSAWNTVKSTASSVWTSIKTTVSTQFTNLKTSLTTTAHNIQSGLSDTWESVKSTATTAWTNLKTTVTQKFNALKTALLGIDFSSIGSNFVSGIKSGINGAWTSFKSWVDGLCGGLISSVKRMFGIHSPSKVFAEIGEYLMEGLGIGVEDGEGNAVKQVRDTAKNIIGSVDSKPEIQLAVDGALSGFDGVVARLSETARIFAAIADALEAMGSLSIPEIAAGSVIPYRTRIPEESGKTNELNQTAFDAKLNELMEYLMDHGDVLRDIRNAVEQKKLSVDIDALTRAITNRQSALIRDYGG